MRKPPKLPDTVGAVPIPSAHDAKEEPNPFTASDWRMWAYAWSGFLLRVLLVVGAVFSAMQYLQSREEKRIERTLALVELWERPEYQQAQAALKRRLADLNRQSASLIDSDTSEQEMAVIASAIGSKAMTEAGGTMPIAEFQEHFDRIVYFLTRLASCVDGNLCDRQVADEFFLDYARSFWGYFADHVARERRRGSPTLGVALEDYLNAPR